MFDRITQKLSPGVENGKVFGTLLVGLLTGSMDMETFAASTDRAQMGASGAVNLVVALVVGGLMAAFLLPIAIDEIASVDTTSWDDGAAALWGILPVMIVLAIFLFFVAVALRRTGRL